MSSFVKWFIGFPFALLVSFAFVGGAASGGGPLGLVVAVLLCGWGIKRAFFSSPGDQKGRAADARSGSPEARVDAAFAGRSKKSCPKCGGSSYMEYYPGAGSCLRCGHQEGL
jgi:hypothetical protein